MHFAAWGEGANFTRLGEDEKREREDVGRSSAVTADTAGFIPLNPRRLYLHLAMCRLLRLVLALLVCGSWLAAASNVSTYPGGRRQLTSVSHAPVSGPAALPPFGGGVYAGGPIPENGRLLLVEDTTSFPFSAIGTVVFVTNEDSAECTGMVRHASCFTARR